MVLRGLSPLFQCFRRPFVISWKRRIEPLPTHYRTQTDWVAPHIRFPSGSHEIRSKSKGWYSDIYLESATWEQLGRLLTINGHWHGRKVGGATLSSRDRPPACGNLMCIMYQSHRLKAIKSWYHQLTHVLRKSEEDLTSCYEAHRSKKIMGRYQVGV